MQRRYCGLAFFVLALIAGRAHVSWGSSATVHTYGLPAVSSGQSSAQAGPAAPANRLGGLTITVVPGSGLAANPDALAAFDRAAASWEAVIGSPINVTINADLTSSGFNNPNIIGQTQNVLLQDDYDTVRGQMVDTSAGRPTQALMSALPTASQFNAHLPSDRSFGGSIVASKANLKALGYTGLDLPASQGGFGASDGSITFNSAFAFDYSRSGGMVAAGRIDFQTAATHEIAHLLGFTSIVDIVDTTTAAQYQQVSPTVLDLFRFNPLTGNPATLNDFTTAPRELTPGAAAVTNDLTHQYLMSTGSLANGGDGNQASHWKDDAQTGSYIGIMDPTLGYGVAQSITAADVNALGLLGYDVVTPEPGTTGVIAIGCLAVLGRRKGRGNAEC